MKRSLILDWGGDIANSTEYTQINLKNNWLPF